MPDRGFGRSLLALLRTRAMNVRSGDLTELDRPVAATEGAYAELFDALLRHSLDSIVLNDRQSRAFIEVSDSFCRATGYARSELLGRTSVELGLVDPDGVHAVATRKVDLGQDGLYETELHCKDGTTRYVEFSQQLLGNEFVLTIMRDITDRRDLESDLRRLADTDPLTGLLNRRRFAEEVDDGLRMAVRFADVATLVVIDLNNMTRINDEYGGAAGDLALQDLAEAMRGAIRATDVAGRLGGDEFAVLLTRHASGEPRRVIGEISDRIRRGRFATAHGEPLTATFGVTQTMGQAGLEAMLAEVAEAMTQGKARHQSDL